MTTIARAVTAATTTPVAIATTTKPRTTTPERVQPAVLERPTPSKPRTGTSAAVQGARELDRTSRPIGIVERPPLREQSTEGFMAQLRPSDPSRIFKPGARPPVASDAPAPKRTDAPKGADGGGPQTPTLPTGAAELADDIAKRNGDAAEALLKHMPDLDEAGAEELSKLLKTASIAKGVSVASLVLDIGSVAATWKQYGLGDERTQDAIAELAGGAAGSAIGAALAGPVGAALGGMVGSWAGPKIADFVRDLADRYGDDVQEAVGTIVDGVEAVGSSIADAAKAAAGVAKDLFDGIFGDGGLVDDLTPDWPW